MRVASSRYSTLSSTTTPRTIAADALGMHVNTSIEPSVPLQFGMARNHSYTSAGVYQNWAGIEPTTKGTRIWTAYDLWLNTNVGNGRKCIVDMSGTPNWAVAAAAVGGSPYPNTKGNMAPDSWTDFTDFITDAATRHVGKVYAYDGWNEPNVPDVPSGQKKYYAGTNATAAYLAQGQRLYYQAVKAADPNALVLAPSFSSVFSGIDGGSGAVGLNQFLAANDGAGGTGAQWFDHIAYHFYCNDNSRRVTGLERMYRGVRASLNAAGRADAEIWAGEVGVLVPELTTYSAADQVALLRAYVIGLFALGCPRVLWFSFELWGTTHRAALATAWNQLYTDLCGATIQSAYVRTLNQTTFEASITTNRGTVSQAITGMPL